MEDFNEYRKYEKLFNVKCFCRDSYQTRIFKVISLKKFKEFKGFKEINFFDLFYLFVFIRVVVPFFIFTFWACANRGKKFLAVL